MPILSSLSVWAKMKDMTFSYLLNDFLGAGYSLNYRVVKRNWQVEKIVNLGHPNDFMTQKSSLIFVKTIFG